VKHKHHRFVYLLIALIGLGSSSIQAQTPTLNEIKTRQAELKEPEKNIPDNQIVLSDELRRVDEEIARYRSAQSIYERANLDLSQIKTLAAKLFQDVEPLDCKALSGVNPQSLWANLYQIQQLVQRLPPSAEPDPWALIIIGDSEKPSPEVVCQGLKGAVGDPAKRQVLTAYIDNRQKEFEEYNTQITSLIASLQKRRGALLPSLSANSTQASLGNDLWKIILLIGLLSIGTIWVIKLFPPDLQKHWVESGQVIQFVTVMILLSVIMALGLASILKENTLGTLLGGIAGYVLSQGVGKAAAQAVTRSLTAGAAQVVPLALSSLSPKTGPVAGGTPVTITGVGFITGGTVTFDGASATVSNMTSTSITAITPAHAKGVVDVIVKNSNGQSATLPQSFTYE
jgi:IPT/TIG domain